jgi:hypothetical protein
VAEPLTGLPIDAITHYRVVVTVGSTAFRGQDETLTTEAAPLSVSSSSQAHPSPEASATSAEVFGQVDPNGP